MLASSNLEAEQSGGYGSIPGRTSFHFIFTLKLFTQGTIQSKYHFKIGPAKATYNIKTLYATKFTIRIKDV